MIYEALAEVHPYGPIETQAGIVHRAGLDPWTEDISGYTVWQLQQLRRVARLMRRMPWRDTQMRGDELMSVTWLELASRGAIADKE